MVINRRAIYCLVFLVSSQASHYSMAAALQPLKWMQLFIQTIATLTRGGRQDGYSPLAQYCNVSVATTPLVEVESV